MIVIIKYSNPDFPKLEREKNGLNFSIRKLTE